MANKHYSDEFKSTQKSENTKFSDGLTFEDLRRAQAEFCKERDWDKYHLPRNLLLALVGEVGELSELFQWRGEVKAGLPDWSAEEKTKLGEELSDVLLYLVRLSEKCGVDLPAAVLDKMHKNRLKYPVDLVRGKSDKYTAYQQTNNSNDDR